MTLYHVMHHVTVVMCLFMVQEKKKEKENYIKRNIKSRKIDNKKRKILVSKLSYTSPLVWKLHPHVDINSELYKPTFHSSYLSCNTSYGSTVTIQVFHLSQRKYSYSTQSSMTELLLSVSQH